MQFAHPRRGRQPGFLNLSLPQALAIRWRRNPLTGVCIHIEFLAVNAGDHGNIVAVPVTGCGTTRKDRRIRPSNVPFAFGTDIALIMRNGNLGIACNVVAPINECNRRAGEANYIGGSGRMGAVIRFGDRIRRVGDARPGTGRSAPGATRRAA